MLYKPLVCSGFVGLCASATVAGASHAHLTLSRIAPVHEGGEVAKGVCSGPEGLPAP